MKFTYSNTPVTDKEHAHIVKKAKNKIEGLEAQTTRQHFDQPYLVVEKGDVLEYDVRNILNLLSTLNLNGYVESQKGKDAIAHKILEMLPRLEAQIQKALNPEENAEEGEGLFAGVPQAFNDIENLKQIIAEIEPKSPARTKAATIVLGSLAVIAGVAAAVFAGWIALPLAAMIASAASTGLLAAAASVFGINKAYEKLSNTFKAKKALSDSLKSIMEKTHNPEWAAIQAKTEEMDRTDNAKHAKMDPGALKIQKAVRQHQARTKLKKLKQDHANEVMQPRIEERDAFHAIQPTANEIVRSIFATAKANAKEIVTENEKAESAASLITSAARRAVTQPKGQETLAEAAKAEAEGRARALASLEKIVPGHTAARASAAKKEVASKIAANLVSSAVETGIKSAATEQRPASPLPPLNTTTTREEAEAASKMICAVVAEIEKPTTQPGSPKNTNMLDDLSHIVLKEVAKKLNEDQNATKIQNAYRQHLARETYLKAAEIKVAEEFLPELEELNSQLDTALENMHKRDVDAAATKLQNATLETIAEESSEAPSTQFVADNDHSAVTAIAAAEQRLKAEKPGLSLSGFFSNIQAEIQETAKNLFDFF